MQQKFDNQIALFIRDETTGRYVFNAEALKALGIDPAEARDRGCALKDESRSATFRRRERRRIARRQDQHRHLVRDQSWIRHCSQVPVGLLVQYGAKYPQRPVDQNSRAAKSRSPSNPLVI
jgi:hypothetical protein